MAQQYIIEWDDGREEPANPETARAAIQRVTADPNHPYKDRTHPRHQRAVEFMTALHRIAFPEGAPPPLEPLATDE